MILMTSYLPAIQELKRGGNVAIADFPESLMMASRLVNAGRAKWSTQDGFSWGSLQYLIPIDKPIDKPVPKSVHVSHWHAGKTTGTREGKFSTAAYPVVSIKGDWVTYELAPGVNHTVKAIYTKVA